MSEYGPHGDQLCPDCDCLDPSCADDQEGCYHSDCINCKCCRRHAPDPVAPQVARVEQALREAETRHARELAEVMRTMHTYLRVWMNTAAKEDSWIEVRDGRLALFIRQDDLRDYANGPALAFEIEPDGETLRISEVTGLERSAP